MIPVDLNRLREARDDFGWNHREADAGTLDTLDATAQAVLDAPTVWWCADFQAGGKDEGTFPEDGTCTICGSNPVHKGCGWHVLVQVKETE